MTVLSQQIERDAFCLGQIGNRKVSCGIDHVVIQPLVYFELTFFTQGEYSRKNANDATMIIPPAETDAVQR